MGAEYFDNSIPVTDPNEAFNSAVEQAQYDHGHAGYTGTIAEKDSFEIKSRTPLSPADLKAEIDATIADNDKWGPAFALPMADKQDKTKIAGWVFYGLASS